MSGPKKDEWGRLLRDATAEPQRKRQVRSTLKGYPAADRKPGPPPRRMASGSTPPPVAGHPGAGDTVRPPPVRMPGRPMALDDEDVPTPVRSMGTRPPVPPDARADADADLARGRQLKNQLARLESHFSVAMDNLFSVYQPIVAAHSGSTFGYEALMRADEPALDTPLALLGAAERLGRLVPLGRAYHRLVAARFARLDGDQSLFLNVHPWELLESDLYSRFMPLARIARRVVLELTEQASLADVADLEDRLLELRDRGYRIAVDNLGAGEGRMSHVPLGVCSFVKIDAAMITGVERDRFKQDFVAHLIETCHQRDVLVVAKGVSSHASWRALADLGCDLLQGNYIGEPSRSLREPTAGRLPLPPSSPASR